MKYFKTFLIYFLVFLYSEVVLKLAVGTELINSNTYNLVFFLLSLSFILNFITFLFKEKIQKFIISFCIILSTLLFLVQFGCFKVFKVYFTLNQSSAATQIFEFTEGIIAFIDGNLLAIVFILLPLAALPIIIKLFDYHKGSLLLTKGINIMLIALSLYGFYSSITINNDDIYSPYNLIFNYNEINLSVQKLGVLNASMVDAVKYFFDIDETLSVLEVSKPNLDTSESVDVSYEYNALSIDFESMNSVEEIATLNSYISQIEATYQNEYTGIFEGKNVIVILAESFNEVAVDKERTPTLYKLINEGFVFENFYTPTISSTLGGEYQLLTGLYPSTGFISIFKSGENTYPYSLANMFESEGYSTYAYHNNTYSFQGRNLYLNAMGFDNYLACGNGLEDLMDCEWLQSDSEMISVTMDDYINSDEPFLSYYVTVSGHGEYTLSGEYSSKYIDLVEGNYSDGITAYLATQIELDKALEILIDELTEKGILEDTVIVLSGDHYPYTLDIDEINEVSDYEKDEIVTVNKSNLIIYNANQDTTYVDKVASQVDILPTIYNLFGIEYDSRMFTGHDIFSDEPGLAIFSDRSWISDYGIYYSASENFVSTTDVTVLDSYVDSMNLYVSSTINISSLISSTDYYKYIKYQ